MKRIVKHYWLIIGLCAGLVGLAVTGGCAATSGKQKPTGFESVIFVTHTNTVEEVVVVPREVWTTNVVQEVVLNEHNVIVTNYVEKYGVVTDYVTETNIISVYTHDVSDDAKKTAGDLAGIVNVFAPGAGTLVGGILIGAMSLWARMRSYKKTGTVLAQNIQAIREFVKTLPDGEKIDNALKLFMSKHQDEAGAATMLATILAKYVKKPQAQLGAQEIKNLIAELST